MALKNAALVGVSQVNFRNVQYPVSPGGLLIGLPADVEEGLLKVGFERVPDPVAKPATAPGAPAAKTPGRTNGLTPDEIRAAIKESVESIRPRNYEEAQTIARRKLMALTGGEVPEWLTAAERVGLGLPPKAEDKSSAFAQRLMATMDGEPETKGDADLGDTKGEEQPATDEAETEAETEAAPVAEPEEKPVAAKPKRPSRPKKK